MIRERERENREFMHEQPSGVDLISLRGLASDCLTFSQECSWRGYARASRAPARGLSDGKRASWSTCTAFSYEIETNRYRGKWADYRRVCRMLMAWKLENMENMENQRKRREFERDFRVMMVGDRI